MKFSIGPIVVTVFTLAVSSQHLAGLEDTARRHIVKGGESLSGIAKAYGTSVDSIVRANELTNPNHIEIGQVLLIPLAPVMPQERQVESPEPNPVSTDALTRQVNSETSTHRISQLLWDAQSSSAMRSLIATKSEQEIAAIVASVDFFGIPLNALAGGGNVPDKRAALAAHFTYQLFKLEKHENATALLAKIKAKLDQKIAIGNRPGGTVPESAHPAFRSAFGRGDMKEATTILKEHLSIDHWRIDEFVKREFCDLAMQALRDNRPRDAALLLDAVLLDYPDDLENEFWRAAAYHNIFADNKTDASAKINGRKAIEAFLKKANGKPDFEKQTTDLREFLQSDY